MLKRFATPHERRMIEAARKLPAMLDPIGSAVFERQAEMDLVMRAGRKRLHEYLPLFEFCRMNGSSGFRMSQILRQFFREYFGRIGKGGPEQLPTSFNVMEAFLRFSEQYYLFDLRDEEEHLLRAYDFFNWYTSEAGMLVEDPAIVKAVLNEGVIYSYDMVGAPNDFLIQLLSPASRY